MVTPLIELLNLVISNRGDFSEAFLREHGYVDLDGPDVQEAILAFAEALPVTQSARLIEIADNLDLDEAFGLDGAADVLSQAQRTYDAIVEAEGVEVAPTDLDDLEDLDLDLDIEDSVDSGVSVSVSVDGDADPDIDVDIIGDDDPSVDIVVNGDEVDLDDLDTDFDTDLDLDTGFLGELASSEEPALGEDDGFELDLD